MTLLLFCITDSLIFDKRWPHNLGLTFKKLITHKVKLLGCETDYIMFTKYLYMLTIMETVLFSQDLLVVNIIKALEVE